MRIHKISLDNFASYDNASLDIDKLGCVINVFGATGAGKTTLLVDSVSFCLFGKAYGEDRTGSERLILRPNKKLGRAELIFSSGEKRYKIIREVELGSGSRASSKVLLLEMIGNEWRNKATGVGAVKEFIDKIIKIDYDTFLKTVAIRQGDVTSILETKPAERRELFLKMLNLDFKKESEIAKNKRDKVKEELSKINASIEEKNKRVEEEPKLLKEIANIDQQVLLLYRYKDTKQKERNDLEQTLKNKEEEYHKLSTELRIYEENMKEYRNKLDRRTRLEQELNKALSEAEKESSYQKEYQEITERLRRLDEFRISSNEIRHKEQELKNIEKRLHEVEKQLKEIKEAEEKLSEIEEKKKELAQLSKDREHLVEMIKSIIQAMESSKAMLEQTRRLKDTLESANLEKRQCPLCGSYLSEEKFDELFHHFLEDERKYQAELNRKEKEKTDYEAKLNSLDSKISDLQRKVAAEDVYKRFISRKTELLEENEGLRKDLERMRKELEDLKDNKLYNEFRNLDPEETRRRLEIQKREIELVLEKIKKERGKIETLRLEIENLDKEIKDMESLLAKKPGEELIKSLEAAISELSLRSKSLDEEIEKINHEIGSLEGRKRSLSEEIEELVIRKKEYEEMFDIYRILCDDIFNERGFPLRFLDSYLEDLNHIINTEYLAPILRNKRVEIKRVENNIEIKVFDDIYERDLATYSGGEKTALGFAIRLAIAKTLALRRGISPKFLIIDEGFGPLSIEIRDLLLRSILNLKSEYEKIFIVSHLEDIQENPIFDSIIRIYKDENNISHIEI